MWRSVDDKGRKPHRLEDPSTAKHTKRVRPHKNKDFHKIERIARSARTIDECADLLDEFDETDY